MPRYLADTHAVLWFAAGETKRLGNRARRAFGGLASGLTRIGVSVVSLWEIALLSDEAKLSLPAGFSAWCDALQARPGMSVEPLLRADIDEARSFRALRDPHDRLIAGTAMRMGVQLITADARLGRDTRVRTLW